jgi:hypothetical protein
VSALREIAGPFVVAPPAGVRVRTRLRVSGVDAAVLGEVGEYLGSLALADLAAQCAEGRLDGRQRARSRQVRKQELTAKSSSRWAGALTRTSEDAYQLAHRNLLAERRSLLARIKRIEARLAVVAGKRAGRVRANAPAAGPHGDAGAGRSGIGSPVSPPPGSVTGSTRWPATPAWPSSRWTRPTPPAGERSTGSPACNSTTPSSPATTRQRS